MPWDTLEAIAHSLGHSHCNPLGISESDDHATDADGEDPMTLHLGLSHHGHRTPQQQADVREARRLLKEQIRTDWDYPPLPQWQSSGHKVKPEQEEGGEEDKVAGFRFHASSGHDRQFQVTSLGHGLETPGLGFDPVEWRERSYSSSESDTDGESITTASSKESGKKIRRIEKFRFEGPDSVGSQIESRRAAKKRKRQQLLEEEMSWNDGMRHWLARRDAWCCARTHEQRAALEADSEKQVDSATASEASPSPRTSTSSTSPEVEAEVSSAPPTSLSSTSSEPSPGLPTAAFNTTLYPSPASPFDLILPLAPLLLPNHPVRARIGPSTYPEIYNKIILQSRTPSVPINLLVLTRAMVKGWKDDGEWPPKQGVLEKSLATKKKGGSGSVSGKGSKVKDGVKGAVGKVLRITHVQGHGEVVGGKGLGV